MHTTLRSPDAAPAVMQPSAIGQMVSSCMQQQGSVALPAQGFQGCMQHLALQLLACCTHQTQLICVAGVHAAAVGEHWRFMIAIAEEAPAALQALASQRLPLY